MTARTVTSTARRMTLPALLVAALISVIGLAGPAAAWAHGEGESDECFVLVRQALAYMANKPDDMMTVKEKVDDALNAPVKNCASPALVSKARDDIEAGHMMQARDLLQHSIHAGHYMGANTTHVITGSQALTGVDTGTLAALDPIPGRAALTTRDWIVLAISITVGLAGVGLAFSLRPRSGVQEPEPKASAS